MAVLDVRPSRHVATAVTLPETVGGTVRIRRNVPSEPVVVCCPSAIPPNRTTMPPSCAARHPPLNQPGIDRHIRRDKLGDHRVGMAAADSGGCELGRDSRWIPGACQGHQRECGKHDDCGATSGASHKTIPQANGRNESLSRAHGESPFPKPSEIEVDEGRAVQHTVRTASCPSDRGDRLEANATRLAEV